MQIYAAGKTSGRDLYSLPEKGQSDLGVHTGSQSSIDLSG
jgi:hypothetical protein